ncbi:hypothetical protein ACFQ7J_17270 [Streptomyces sp. NPDC056501]|uniref:hypothetical protein n=1 Tax=Streptomyces sp. NPDC056501 TaxID=3345841 RepID=UPI0036A21A7B
MIRKPAGVPDDSEEDRAARRLEEFRRARGLPDEGTGDEAKTDEADTDEAETDEAEAEAEADEPDESDETAGPDDGASEEETDASGAVSDPGSCPDPPEGRPTEP